MKQHEAVLLAMKQNGGYATLGQLYQTSPKIPGSNWSGTKNPFANIRRIVQTHDEFFKIRPGLWALTSEKDRVLSLFSDENPSPKKGNTPTIFTKVWSQKLETYKAFKRLFLPKIEINLLLNKNWEMSQLFHSSMNLLMLMFYEKLKPLMLLGSTIESIPTRYLKLSIRPIFITPC